MGDTSIRLDRSSTALMALPQFSAELAPSIVTEWQQQLTRYAEFWRWMDGQIWEQVDKYAVVGTNKQAPLIFPIQLNPLYTAALMHRYTLFGEVPDTGSPLVRPFAIPKIDWESRYEDEGERGVVMSGSVPTLEANELDDDEKQSRRNADEVSEILDTIWYQSDGRSSMLDAGFVSQTLGGCVWKVSYEPWNPHLEPGLPIAFRQIEPEYFLPIYNSRDRWHLLGCRVGYMIDAYEAREVYGVQPQGATALYLESWDMENGKARMQITVDGQSVSMQMPNGDRYDPSGILPYNFIPFVYIPHEIVGAFYGVPIIYQLGALLKEINGRAADIGDAVRNSIERIFILSNTDPAEVQLKDLGNGIRVMATGKEVPGSKDKRIDVANPPALPTGTADFIKFLEHSFWHGAFTPPVAYGEDEGSQRSALTLAFRMWPLTSHIRAERSLWTTALRVMSQMALQMLQARQGEVPDGSIRIEPRHMGHKIQWDWSPMIPRDQAAEVEQYMLRHQDKQLSAQTSMEKIGDIADVQEELRRLQQEELETARRTAASAAVTAQLGGGPFGAGSGASSAPARRPRIRAGSE